MVQQINGFEKIEKQNGDHKFDERNQNLSKYLRML